MVSRKALPLNESLHMKMQHMSEGLWQANELEAGANSPEVEDVARPDALGSQQQSDFFGEHVAVATNTLGDANSDESGPSNEPPKTLRTEINLLNRKSLPVIRENVKQAPMNPKAPQVPADLFSQLSLSVASYNPGQSAKGEGRGASASSAFLDLDNGNHVQGSAGAPHNVAPAPSSSAAVGSPLLSEGDPRGCEIETRQRPNMVATQSLSSAEKDALENKAWSDVESTEKGKAPVPETRSSLVGGDWKLVDVAPPPGPLPGRTETQVPGKKPETEAQRGQDGSSVASSSTATHPFPMPPGPVGETYQIKDIRWCDARTSQNPRVSPILLQNENGPCPLVALVNALVLSTPADMGNTSLAEVLRTREQVSFSLLLQSLFDELITRSGTPDAHLPDMSDLYAFLQGLQTGMNVNPRFIPAPRVVTKFTTRSMQHFQPISQEDLIPGTFEDTKDMQLYATFSIPLIHGWLPSRTDPAYSAFSRHACSYEKAQDLLIREDDLEDKLSDPNREGLTEEEQQIYQDILTIKSFLSRSSTQLTPWGLQVITKAIRPGSVAILFRNDHFSTLYRHPRTLRLMALVTDAGYASHEDIVWQSLVDVSGERAEFFSGEFRVVGGASPVENSHVDRAGDSGSGWTMVQGQGKRNNGPSQILSSANHVQEDHDLALALQLQEEEEERNRAELKKRRWDSKSPGQNGIGSSSRGSRSISSPAIEPPRRSSSAVHNQSSQHFGRGGNAAARAVRSMLSPIRPGPAVNRAAEADGADEPPPSYEQAAKQTPYVPLQGHPSHPGSLPSPNSGGNGHAATTSRRRTASSQGANTPVHASPAGRTGSARTDMAGFPAVGVDGRLRQGISPVVGTVGGNSSGGGSGRDRDCAVM